MKRSILIQVGGLLLIFLLLSFLDRDSDYVSEIAYWRIDQRLITMSKDPKSYPDNTFTASIQDYEDFIARFPRSRLTPEAHISMGRVYLLKKNYEKARRTFEDVAYEYASKADIASEALLEVARSYALEGKFENVLSTYSRIMKEYPMTKIGLMTPLLVAKFYGDNGKRDEASDSLEKAVMYYRNLLDKETSEDIRWEILRSLSSCQAALQRWPESVDTLRDMLFLYPHSADLDLKEVDDVVKTINTISIGRLEDYDLPIRIYRDFIQQNPTHPLGRSLARVAQSLEKLKKNQEEGSVTDE